MNAHRDSTDHTRPRRSGALRTSKLMSGGVPPDPLGELPSPEDGPGVMAFIGGLISLALVGAALLAFGSAIDRETNIVAADFGGAPSLGLLAIVTGVATLLAAVVPRSPRGDGHRTLRKLGAAAAALAIAVAVVAGMASLIMVDNT